MSKRDPVKLFARWFWFVYLPLGLTGALLLLAVSGFLPGKSKLLLIPFIAYSVVGARLILERRKLGFSIPAPAQVLVGIGSVAGMVLIGGLLFGVGWDRLGDGHGLFLVYLGGFLMVLSVTTPMFKLIDVLVRSGGRVLGRRSARRR